MTLPVPKSSELPDPDSEAAERRPDLDGLLLLLEVANPGFLHGMEDALEAAHPDVWTSPIRSSTSERRLVDMDARKWLSGTP